MIIYVIEKIAFDDEQNPQTLKVLHAASSLELAHSWIKQNYSHFPEEEYTWFFTVYSMALDGEYDTEDKELYIFDHNGLSIKE